MNKSTDPLSWINVGDSEQTAWVDEYLKRQLPEYHLDTINPNRIEIRTYDHRLLNEDKLTILISKMRSAWRQKVFRSKQNGKKTYSFVMGRGIEAKLKALSGKGEIRKTLEALIEHTYNFTAPKIKELKTKNQELTHKISTLHEDIVKIQLANTSLDQAVNIKDNEIDTLKKEIKVLQQDYAYLSLKLERLMENKPDDKQ